MARNEEDKARGGSRGFRGGGAAGEADGHGELGRARGLRAVQWGEATMAMVHAQPDWSPAPAGAEEGAGQMPAGARAG